MVAVVLYLAAACAANATVTVFGYAALPYTAALLIPFDLTARDVLHDRWHNDRLIIRMFALVSTGSVLSWLFCNGAPTICIASAVAFAVAAFIDTVVYAALDQTPRLVKMNGSNIASSTADSIVFPLVAFATWSPQLAATQIALKIAGGFVWSIIFAWGIKQCRQS